MNTHPLPSFEAFQADSAALRLARDAAGIIKQQRALTTCLTETQLCFCDARRAVNELLDAFSRAYNARYWVATDAELAAIASDYDAKIRPLLDEVRGTAQAVIGAGVWSKR